MCNIFFIYNFKIFPHARIQHTFVTKQFLRKTISVFVNTFFSHDAPSCRKPGLPHYQDFTITLRHATRSMAPLAKRSARLRDLYLTTHNTHKRQTYMPPAGCKPTIPASEQVSDLRLRPRGQRDRLCEYLLRQNVV
jgi:hypothetical protein